MISSVFRRYLTTTRMVSQQTTDKVQQLIKTKPVFIASKVCTSDGQETPPIDR